MPTKYLRHAPPVGGFSDAVPAEQLQSSLSPNLLNIRFRFGEVRPGPGRAALTAAVGDSPIQAIARFSVDDVHKWVVLLTDNAMYTWGDQNQGPGVPANWVKVSGVALTGQGRWSWCTGEDCFFFTRRGGGGVYRWRGGTNPIDMVPNAPFTDARYVEYFNYRLCVANVDEAGKSWANRVRYPVNGDHTNWTGPGSGFTDLYEPEQEPIQAIKVLSNRLVVLREHSLVDLAASGSTALVFDVEQRTSNVGTLFPHTVACNGIMLFFLGNDGNLWAWDGAQLNPIGTPIYQTLENIVDLVGGRDLYFGKVWPYMHEYWLWIGNKYVYVFDYLNNRWMIDMFPNISAIGDGEFYVSPNDWAHAVGPWTDWSRVTWNEEISRATSRMIAGLTDNTTITIGKDVIGYNTGEKIDCFYETKDYYANEYPNNPMGWLDPVGPMVERTIERGLFMYTYNNDADEVEVSVSTDHGVTWTTMCITPIPLGYGYADWKVTGAVARFRVRQTSAKPVFRWLGLIEEFVPGGPFVALEQIPGTPP